MLRRRFFHWISTSAIPFLAPRFSRAQAEGIQEREVPMLLALAGVVLPGSLGSQRIEEVGNRFVVWTRGYRAGADAGYGYGFPHPEVLPANPASGYLDQFHELDLLAAPKGGSFRSIDAALRRGVVIEALEKAGIERMPNHPNGKHVAADLLAFFYNSADGQDFLHNAAIKRDDCRGLASSGRRPAALS
jgi:hypothetical protein